MCQWQLFVVAYLVDQQVAGSGTLALASIILVGLIGMLIGMLKIHWLKIEASSSAKGHITACIAHLAAPYCTIPATC